MIMIKWLRLNKIWFDQNYPSWGLKFWQSPAGWTVLKININRSSEFSGGGIRTELLLGSIEHSSLSNPPPLNPHTVSHRFYSSGWYCYSSTLRTRFPTAPFVDIYICCITVIRCSILWNVTQWGFFPCASLDLLSQGLQFTFVCHKRASHSVLLLHQWNIPVS